MIYKVKFTVRDEERWLTCVSYKYNIKFSDSPDIDKIIEIHQEMSAQLGVEQNLPIEGGLLRLRFPSTDHDQFFYDWLITAMMEDGSIEFLQNEVETVSRINFWDCYCVSVEEWMSANGAPMEIELVLSPAIFKKDRLTNEKMWKVTDIHANKEVIKMVEETTKKEDPIFITDAYWIDEKGNQQRELSLDFPVTLYIQLEDYVVNRSVNLVIKDDSLMKEAKCSGKIDAKGIITIEEFKLEPIDNESW